MNVFVNVSLTGHSLMNVLKASIAVTVQR